MNKETLIEFSENKRSAINKLIQERKEFLKNFTERQSDLDYALTIYKNELEEKYLGEIKPSLHIRPLELMPIENISINPFDMIREEQEKYNKEFRK